MSINIHSLRKSDFFGAAISTLCAIHCALSPILFAAKPILERTVHHDDHGHGFWRIFDFAFLILSLFAVRYSAKHTLSIILRWILWVAWIIFAAGILLEPLEMAFTKWLMYVGSITLVITHLKNYQYCKSATV